MITVSTNNPKGKLKDCVKFDANWDENSRLGKFSKTLRVELGARFACDIKRKNTHIKSGLIEDADVSQLSGERALERKPDSVLPPI